VKKLWSIFCLFLFIYKFIINFYWTFDTRFQYLPGHAVLALRLTASFTIYFFT
ncbi:hypothetical protein BY996DRAFT_7290791, partial [Phakopsora pachyrhizi]